MRGAPCAPHLFKRGLGGLVLLLGHERLALAEQCLDVGRIPTQNLPPPPPGQIDRASALSIARPEQQDLTEISLHSQICCDPSITAHTRMGRSTAPARCQPLGQLGADVGKAHSTPASSEPECAQHIS
jgi:hypothetical protein